jgi:hypothetical protein
LTPHNLFDILFTEKVNHFGIFLNRHDAGKIGKAINIPGCCTSPLYMDLNGYVSANKLYVMSPICISEHKPSGEEMALTRDSMAKKKPNDTEQRDCGPYCDFIFLPFCLLCFFLPRGGQFPVWNSKYILPSRSGIAGVGQSEVALVPQILTSTEEVMGGFVLAVVIESYWVWWFPE